MIAISLLQIQIQLQIQAQKIETKRNDQCLVARGGEVANYKHSCNPSNEKIGNQS